MRKQSGGIFAIKFLALLATVSLILVGLNVVYVNGTYYTDRYGEIQKFKNVPMGITLANTGTSHGLASFCYPEDIDRTVFNFALSGEDIYHDFHTIKQFSDHLDEGCVIAIPVSYFSFCMSVDEPSQKRYYTYMDTEYLRGFNYETLINTKYLPVLRSGEFLFKDLINDRSIDIGGMMLNRETTNKEPNSSTDAQLQAKESALAYHATGRAESWRSGYMLLNSEYMSANQQLLIDMINYCKDQGWKPLLVTTPIHHTLNEAFTEEELETFFFSNMRTVQEITSVPYYDMSHDTVFSYTPEYYANSDHLNQKGGEAFTAVFLAYLEEIEYI